MPTDYQLDERDELDRQMIHLAATRSKVLYLDNHGNEFPVTLISWRQGRGRARCRIELRPGSQATVPTFLVRPIPKGTE
jgi:hypothetical protein